MNKDNKKFIVETLFLKESLKYNLSLKEFIILMYFDNDYDLTFDVKKVSKATCLSEEDTLEAFNILLDKKLIKLNSIKNDSGKIVDKVSLENFYNDLKNTIKIEDEKQAEDSIFSKFQASFGKSLSGMDYEIINAWLDKNFSEEMILLALDEAKKNNVTSLRYIDKILFDWEKKGYKTSKDISTYEDDIADESEKEFETRVLDFNWLDNDE